MSTARREKKKQRRGRKPGPGITFARTWTASSDDGAWLVVSNQHLPKQWRLFELARRHMNDYGHAVIPANEAEEELYGRADKSARDHVVKVMRQLVDAGIFGSVSTRLCIVLNADHTQRGTGRSGSCPEFAHTGHQRHRWHGNDWEYIDYETGEVGDARQESPQPASKSDAAQLNDQAQRGIALDSSQGRRRGGHPLLTGPGHRATRRHRGRRMTTR